MNEPTSQPPPEAAREAVDDQGRLIENIGCRRCGYNLRSLQTDAVCPECGAAVVISIHGYYLRFAPLDWVRRLALGAKLLLASIATAFVGWLAIMGIGFATAMSMATAMATATSQTVIPAGPSPAFQLIMTATMIGLSLVVTGLLIAGVILLTARDPAEVGKPERLGSRRLARYCLWSIPVAMVAGGAMSFANYGVAVPVLTPVMIGIWIVIGIAVITSNVIMPAAVLRRFIGLMTRIPRPGLAKFGRIEFWAYLIVTVLGFGVYAVAITTFRAFATAAFAAAATTTTAATTGPATRLSQLGSVGVPTPAPITAPTSAPAGSSVKTDTFVGGRQVMVTTSGSTSMPATMPFAATPRNMTFAIITAFAGALGGCGGLAVAIAGLVFLIMAWRALAKAAKQAESHPTAIVNTQLPHM